MARRLKLLAGLSTIAVAGAVALSGCSGADGEGEGAKSSHAATHGEGEGEGQKAQPLASGGESEGAALADIAHDKAAYLSGLTLVRGHLRAGTDLYDTGERDIGVQHMRHPQAEIMTTLAPAFAAYGATSFAPALEALAEAGERGAPPAEIGDLYEAALREIAAAGASAGATTKERLLAVAKTLTVAGDEYSVAIKDGAIVNLHEYHDAYGFIAVALADLKAMKASGDAETSAVAAAIEQVKVAETAAPAATPPADGFKPASTIYGAAARIEIVARGLD